ncbi:MAG TPA: hypothetical protein VFE46_02680 [Pirellulales bacterium]|jgi:hypothetical protein|nr:hypothetical protein [Pirellulales bacterium]
MKAIASAIAKQITMRAVNARRPIAYAVKMAGTHTKLLIRSHSIVRQNEMPPGTTLIDQKRIAAHDMAKTTNTSKIVFMLNWNRMTPIIPDPPCRLN